MDKDAKWGDLESEEEESEEEEEEEEEEEGAEDDGASLADGLASVAASGYGSSLPSGIETPEVLNLRKGTAGAWGACLGIVFPAPLMHRSVRTHNGQDAPKVLGVLHVQWQAAPTILPSLHTVQPPVMPVGL